MSCSVGGWSWSGVGRVESGPLVSLSGVRLVNMTRAELQQAYYPRTAADGTITMLPDDVIVTLNLDRAARLERDRRRLSGRPRRA